MKPSAKNNKRNLIHGYIICLASLILAGCTAGKVNVGIESEEKSNSLLYVNAFLSQADKSKIYINMTMQQFKVALTEASIPSEPIKLVENTSGFTLYTLPLGVDESGRWSAKIVFVRDRLDYFSISKVRKSLYERFYCRIASDNQN